MEANPSRLIPHKIPANEISFYLFYNKFKVLCIAVIATKVSCSFRKTPDMAFIIKFQGLFLFGESRSIVLLLYHYSTRSALLLLCNTSSEYATKDQTGL